MKLPIAVIQSKTYRGPKGKDINIGRAKDYIDEAADRGAKMICFPESFPGPWRSDQFYSPFHDLGAKAKEREVYVIYGSLEPSSDGIHYYNILELVGPTGELLGQYRRTTPLGPWIYKGGQYWDFNYQVGDLLPVFETKYCTIGLLLCSEVFVPELARILALKGAEIIFMPNGKVQPNWFETWSILLQARAHENLAVTTTCRNIFEEEEGLAMIAGPEGTLLKSHEEGVHLAEVDLDRLRWLRENEDKSYGSSPRPYIVKPGLLTQWRRPELYAELAKE